MLKIPFCDLGRANRELKFALLAAVDQVLESGRYLMGPSVEAFETALAASLDRTHAVATASGTDACELAIRALGWGTVATPAFGAVPTISAIEAAGAIPVLVDVDTITRGVSFDTLAQARTDGAMVIHMFGQMCDVPANAIEDCAHAQGAETCFMDLWFKAGSIGRAAALSFFPTKCLGALGDGGAVVTAEPDVAARVRALRHYGGLLDGDVTMRGQNSRLSELGAAMLTVKLRHLAAWNDERRRIAARYRAELAGRVTVPTERGNERPSYHCFVIESDERDRLKVALEARGIGVMVHYPKPIHFYRRWRHLGERGDFPVAERLAETVLSVPCFVGMTEAEQSAVIAAVKDLT